MKITKYFENRKVRITIIKNEPYFNAQDTCNMLGLSNTSRSISNLSKDDIRLSNVIDTLGRNTKVYFISEQGLYDLIFKSKKKEAREFQKWVTHEVIPSIRKTGKYSIPDEIKKLSTKKRNLLTDEWKNHGIEKPHHFIQLTLQEYKAMGVKKGVRKEDMDKKQLLLLSALESMEMFKLFENDNVTGYYECKDSLIETADMIKQLENKKGIEV